MKGVIFVLMKEKSLFTYNTVIYPIRMKVHINNYAPRLFLHCRKNSKENLAHSCESKD